MSCFEFIKQLWIFLGGDLDDSLQCHLQNITSSPLLSSSRTPGASRNPRDLPDGVSDASLVGQPRLRGQPIGALREVRQGPHRPVTQARASCAPQRAIAPAPTPAIDKTPPSALDGRRGMVSHRGGWCGRVQREHWEGWEWEKRQLREHVQKEYRQEGLTYNTCCTPSLKKIFKWHERGDKTRDGRAAPLLGTNSNMYGVSRGPNGAAAFCSTFSKQLLWRTVAETITYIAHM